VSYYANRAERQKLIAGLLALVEFLTENEEVPAPKYIDVLVFPHEGDDDADRREVDRIAALFGVTTQTSAASHYVASRTFGPVEYRATAIPTNKQGAHE
jgi:hypothetical protein